MKRWTRTRRGRSNGEEVFIYLYVFVCGDRERERERYLGHIFRASENNKFTDGSNYRTIYLRIYLLI